MRRLLAMTVLFMLVRVAPAAVKRIICPPGFRPNMLLGPEVQVDDTLYCAGQTGSDLKTGEHPGDFEEEVRQAFRRFGNILRAADSDAVDVTVYLADISLFPEISFVYSQYTSRRIAQLGPSPSPASSARRLSKSLSRRE